MGLFDFFKKKEENMPKPEEQQEGVLEIEGLELEQPVEENEEVVLVLEEGESETAAISHAVHEMMGENDIEIHRATPDVLYQEDATGAEEMTAEESTELEEITSEEPEETAEPEEITAEEAEAPEPVRPDEPEDREKAEPDPEPKKGFFARLKEGLDKTRRNIMDGVDSVLGSFTKIDEDLFEELEEALIMADLGVQTTMEIVNRLRNRVKKEHATDPSLVKGMLIEEITEMLSEGAEEEENLPAPTVMLVIGVNGVGKTTTIGKLAHSFKKDGKAVLLAAADTFRAAAADQLEIWSQRAKADLIRQHEGADPGAVLFDALQAAKARGVDVVLCDTAGRLHNKKNLMEELRKMNRIVDREFPDAHRENLIVLDGTTGQNALVQAREFGEVADLTGIILTKMDGTAKGGIAVAIQSELRVPVKYIGVGETIDDLQKFDSDEFVNALFDVKTEGE